MGILMEPRKEPKRKAVRSRQTQKAGNIRSTRCHRYRPTVLWSALAAIR